MNAPEKASPASILCNTSFKEMAFIEYKDDVTTASRKGQLYT